jgi:predicted phage terminase large subunit-like protein
MENTPAILQGIKLNLIDECLIEANGVGLAAVFQVQQSLKGVTKLTPFTSSEQKEVRILSNYEFIRMHFVFDINYQSRPQYNQFIKDLTSYIQGGDNKHKMDAIDVLCTAANALKIKFGRYIY